MVSGAWPYIHVTRPLPSQALAQCSSPRFAAMSTLAADAAQALPKNHQEAAAVLASLLVGGSASSSSSSSTPEARPAIIPVTSVELAASEATVELSSAEGRFLFQRALAAGHLEGYFPLSQNAVTQTDPRIAPLSTLSVVLNALSHDPGVRWKGPWRWNSEDMMLCSNKVGAAGGGGKTACGHTPEMLDRDLTVADFSAMARCKGVRAVRHGAGGAGGGEALRARIREVCGDKEARMQMVIKISRENQASSSHGVFCIVAGYSEERDMVLVMDVARSSHAPAWVELASLWSRMEAAREGKMGGGYVILSSWTTEEPTQAELCPTTVRSWAEQRYSGRRQQQKQLQHFDAVRPSTSQQQVEATLRADLGRGGREASSAVPVAA